jgi:inorganic pyrophosphatase
MGNLASLANQLDAKKIVCRAIIETPKGCRNKFDCDPDSGLFMLGGLLPEGMMFPFDFGFIPSTLGKDGDPLDIMVPMDAPAHVGCLMKCASSGSSRPSKRRRGRPKAMTGCWESRSILMTIRI